MINEEHFRTFGAYIALIAIFGKTIFDVFINKYIYNRDLPRYLNREHLALRRKNTRANISTTIAFIMLAISYVATIKGGEVMETKNKMELKKIRHDITLLVNRVKRLEDALFPPGGGGGGPVSSDDLEILKADIEARIDMLETEQQNKFRDLYKEIQSRRVPIKQ